MLQTIIKGILIGILVSAPMGPVGILCVQRTLSRGRWHGFVSGLGATLSDVLYALITLLGISLVTDFLEKNELGIQVAGSVVLILFGIAVYRSNPFKGLKPSDNLTETRYTKDFISSFFLTVSNIVIIFVFITLYARFSFNPVDRGFWFLMLGVASVAIGAMLWWLFITTIVSRLRIYISRGGLLLLNRVIGVILMIIGVVGIITGFV